MVVQELQAACCHACFRRTWRESWAAASSGQMWGLGVSALCTATSVSTCTHMH